jgi:hypothetical protein
MVVRALSTLRNFSGDDDRMWRPSSSRRNEAKGAGLDSRSRRYSPSGSGLWSLHGVRARPM